MTEFETIETLALAIRIKLDKYVPYGGEGWVESLMGACGLASVVLAKSLIARSIKAFVRYTSKEPLENGHAWVETNGLVVDITASQFGYENVVILRTNSAEARRRGYKGKIIPLDDPFWNPDRWEPPITKQFVKKFMIRSTTALVPKHPSWYNRSDLVLLREEGPRSSLTRQEKLIVRRQFLDVA